MRFYTTVGIILIFAIAFLTCKHSFEQQVEEDNYDVMSSISKWSNHDSTFIFQAESGFEHQWASGTKILIPEGILMKSNGQLVNGEVELTFKEYRDALEMVADGFLMEANSMISKTAGAFYLDLKQDGKKLYLDPTKSIDVKLACYEKEDDYSLYYLNENENKWDSLFIVLPEINEHHVQLERKIKHLQPQVKFPLNEDHFAFSYKGILDVIYNNNLTNVHHPLTVKKMKQYGLRWLNINVEQFIDFHGKKEFAPLMVWRNVSRKPFPEWTNNAKNRLEKINKTRYRLVVEDRTGAIKFSTQIEAVMPLKELFAYGPGFWKSDFERKEQKVKETLHLLSQTPSAYRSFKVTDSGLYNWQKVFDETESVLVNSQFKFEGSGDLSGVFYLSGDLKGLIYYPDTDLEKLKLFVDPGAMIFSILRDGKVLYFPKEGLKNIEFDQLKKMNNPSYIFKMEIAPQPPTSLKVLKEILTANP